VLLFYAVIPGTWLIEDEALRRSVTRVVTSRYATLTVISLGGLLLSGLYLYSSDVFVPPDVRTNMMSYRFGPVFTLKMIAVVLLVVLIGVHAMVFGRRVREASEALERGEGTQGALEAARRSSLMFSVLLLLLSIAVLFMGVTLGNHAYSHEPI
jgi:hypothetical protein